MQISSNTPQLTPIEVTSDFTARSGYQYTRQPGADTARPKSQTQLRERSSAHAVAVA